ncbi:MAG: hypothetical protein P1P77_04770 [Spirochaetaceae bacterium]|nr:hypothetical protein [Spirochaetaceae bacterium]
MMDMDKSAIQWFRWMGTAGLVLSLVGFFFYSSGLWPAEVTPEESAKYWDVSSEEYLAETGLEFGSLWFLRPLDGYMVGYLALAILATTALPALLALSLGWLRRREWSYGLMALATSAVLVTAILR